MVSLLVFKGHRGSWQGLEEMPVVGEGLPRAPGASWWTPVAGLAQDSWLGWGQSWACQPDARERDACLQVPVEAGSSKLPQTVSAGQAGTSESGIFHPDFQCVNLGVTGCERALLSR